MRSVAFAIPCEHGDASFTLNSDRVANWHKTTGVACVDQYHIPRTLIGRWVTRSRFRSAVIRSTRVHSRVIKYTYNSASIFVKQKKSYRIWVLLLWKKGVRCIRTVTAVTDSAIGPISKTAVFVGNGCAGMDGANVAQHILSTGMNITCVTILVQTF